MDPQALQELQASYDRVASEYAHRLFDELKGKPLDREWLERFAQRLRGSGMICDLGCGPGQIARYLSEQGATVCGVDLSPGMVEQARWLNPGIEFHQGNMLRLEVENEAWAGIAAFYSIIHVPREELSIALGECLRVLKPGGLLLLAFHLGDETVHVEELWGQPMNADFAFLRSEFVLEALRGVGFVIEDAIERSPYDGAEHSSHRGYVLAGKP